MLTVDSPFYCLGEIKFFGREAPVAPYMLASSRARIRLPLRRLSWK